MRADDRVEQLLGEMMALCDEVGDDDIAANAVARLLAFILVELNPTDEGAMDKINEFMPRLLAEERDFCSDLPFQHGETVQ